jgi:hypothetical protein
MNKFSNQQKIIEALGEGTLGSASGIIGGLYFSENMLLLLILGGVGAVLGKVLIPQLVDNITKLSFIKKKIIPIKRLKLSVAVFMIFLLVVGYGYLTIDNYSKGQKLYTKTQVKLKEHPGVGGNTITIVNSNSEVTYLDKGWKRLRWYEDGKRFFNFWRKVRVQNGKIGWIYGGYLAEQRQ